jgi:hypothetical protein
MTITDNNRTQRLANWANRLVKEMFNTPDGARCDALKATYSEVDALLKAELRKANPGLDDAEIFWLAAEAQFPGVIDRVIERFGALGYSLTAGPPAPAMHGLARH